MTDDDAVIANERIREATYAVLQSQLSLYGDQHYAYFGGATPFAKDDMLSDLLALPDLVAGAIEHYFTREEKMGAALTVSEDANRIQVWLCHQGLALKKQTIRIVRDSQGQLLYTNVTFVDKAPSPDATVIPLQY